MARVVLTASAETGIEAIGRYVFRESQDLQAALRVLDRIDEKTMAYARQPEMDDLRPDLGAEVRCFPVGNYVVIYRPLEDGILVLLVVHGSRDVPAVFRDQFGSNS